MHVQVTFCESRLASNTALAPVTRNVAVVFCLIALRTRACATQFSLVDGSTNELTAAVAAVSRSCPLDSLQAFEAGATIRSSCAGVSVVKRRERRRSKHGGAGCASEFARLRAPDFTLPVRPGSCWATCSRMQCRRGMELLQLMCARQRVQAVVLAYAAMRCSMPAQSGLSGTANNHTPYNSVCALFVFVKE